MIIVTDGGGCDDGSDRIFGSSWTLYLTCLCMFVSMYVCHVVVFTCQFNILTYY